MVGKNKQPTSNFDASASALGYFFQFRYGLYQLLQGGDESKLYIEKLDDVSIEKGNEQNLFQTKYHVELNGTPNLSNSSPDLWKTIRVWSEGVTAGRIALQNSYFHLVTTARTAVDSIPYKLKEPLDNDQVKEVVDSLVEVAKTSKNQVNARAYKAFLELNAEQRRELLKRISIADASVDLIGLKDKIIENNLRLSAFKVEALFERLEGWYIDQVAQQLLYRKRELSGKDVRLKVLEIADGLTSDNLPADFLHSIVSDESQLAPYRDKMFVKQLELVSATSKMIDVAISDFFRAYSQKSKWLRDGLITPEEEITYDLKLYDDWEGKFAATCEIDGASDEVKLKSTGRAFYVSHYVTNCPQLYIKDRFKERYMITGSYHILADGKRIGWHPEFKSRL